MTYPKVVSIERGRLDKLVIEIAAHLVRTHAPGRGTELWDNGLGALAQYAVNRVLPQAPVVSVQLGQVQIPLDMIAIFARAAKLLPEAPRVG